MRSLVAAMLLITLIGCEQQPSAPALTNETIFRQDDLGLRFAAPDGWLIRAKSAIPPGKLETPIRVVEYARTTETSRAEFDVYVTEPHEGDLIEYLAKHPIGPEKWIERGATKSTTVGDAPAKSYHLIGTGQRANMHREIYAVTRQSKTILFLITHAEKDTKALREAMKALETVTWKE
jgi:hypothetical protein